MRLLVRSWGVEVVFDAEAVLDPRGDVRSGG
jgi:hypothetical protein